MLKTDSKYNTTAKRDLAYLKFLGKSGSAFIHPKGKSATYKLINELKLKEGLKVLEVGFGTGETLMMIASQYKVQLTGVEILPEMYKSAKAKLKFAGLTNKPEILLIKPQIIQNSDKEHAYKNNIEPTNYKEFFQLPFQDQSFDRVFCESVLGFLSVKEIHSMISEINRILKHEGIFVANEAVWKDNLDPMLVAEINKKCIRDFGLSQASLEYISLNIWIKLFQEAGFKIKSADLIEADSGLNRFIIPGISSSFKLKTLSGYYRIKRILNPYLLKNEINYRKKLELHIDDGKYIEPRLFVMEKSVQ